jgi:DNA polymerase-3 subunit beta
MASILSTSDDDVVTIEYVNDQLIVKSDARFVLAVEDPATYPTGVIPSFDSSSYYQIKAGDLKKMIDRTLNAIDVDNTTYALGGVRLRIGADAILGRPGIATMAATDGKRLSEQRAGYSVVSGAGNGTDGLDSSTGSYVIPVKAAKLLVKVIGQSSDSSAFVDIVPVVNSSALLFRIGGSVIYSRLLEKRFPGYAEGFAKVFATLTVSLAVDPAVLLRKIEQASIVKSDESNMIIFDISPGLMALSSVTSGVGSSDVVMEIDYSGEPFSVGLDHRYISDGLRDLKGETVRLKMRDAKNPVVVIADEHEYTIQPITIGDHKAAVRDDIEKSVAKAAEKAEKAGKKRGAA